MSLVAKLEELFGVVVVYDIHSHNWRRWEREIPVINLGTANVDNDRFGDEIETWRQSLSELKLPYKIKATSKINDTFLGNGYFLKYITKNFENTLVLATEFKKIYCDERDGVIFPEVVSAIEEQLRPKLIEHATSFYKIHKPKV